MFAAFLLDHDYPKLESLRPYLDEWNQTYGLVAFIILAIWALVAALRRQRGSKEALRFGMTGQLRAVDPGQGWKLRIFWALGVATAVAWCVVLPSIIGLVGYILPAPTVSLADLPPRTDPQIVNTLGFRLAHSFLFQAAYRIACALALVTLAWEPLVALFYLSGRRLWALARFSIKEAIHRKILWGFLLLMLVFLFASWFIPQSKPGTQWKTYVNLVFFIMAALTLITASVVSCFSLPADIRNLSIHTVVTKPVQKFEVVLGRILGLVLLLTVVLLAAGHLSLLFAYRGVDERTRATALRARNQIIGQLSFEELTGTEGKWVKMEKGISVGREFDLRKYIAGGQNQEGVWRFRLDAGQLSRLRSHENVTIEFNFDIFRTSKGGGRRYTEGVDIMMAFVNKAKWSDANYNKYREQIHIPVPERARTFGYYELPRPIRIVDEQTEQSRLQIPSTLLDGIENGDLEVRVSCRTHAQYLGLYKYDLYLLDEEGSFYLNYLKGLFGIWCWMVIVVCLGTIFSTYLNAPVSLLLVWLLLVCGLPTLRDTVGQLIDTKNQEVNPGGGPFEAMYRLFNNIKISQQLEQNQGTKLIQTTDQQVFERFFAALYRILPDLGQYDRTLFVAEGFNSPGGELVAAFLLLLIYLIPYLLFGYYLINLRELATW